MTAQFRPPHICPRCNAETTVRFPVAYQQGQSVTNISATSRNIVSGTTFTSGQQFNQSQTSRMTAPPPKPSFNLAPQVILGGLFGFFTLALSLAGGRATALWAIPLFVLLAAGLAFWAVTAKKNHDSKMPQWNAAMQQWERSWLCNRCGLTYVA